MAFDLEEQEQIATLKAWWHDWGRYLATVLVIGMLAYAGHQGWNYWQQRQATQAATLFEQIQSQEDLAKARVAHEALKKDFPGTAFASRSALVMANRLYLKGDKAGAGNELNWVVAHSKEPFVRDVAKQRLALLSVDAQKYDEALKLLSEPESDALVALFARTRGDILLLKGDRKGAKDAYQKALAKLKANKSDNKDSTAKDEEPMQNPEMMSIETKLDYLGG